MIEPLRITETKAQIAAVIHLTIPRDQVQREMPLAIEELMAAVSAQGLRTFGPLFAHHLKMSPDVFDFEVGFPVSAPITPAARVKSGGLPAAKIARTVYHGGYEGLFAAWSEFGKRAKAELAEQMEKEGLKHLANGTQLSADSIDQKVWGTFGGQSVMPRPDFEHRVVAAARQPRWAIDGNYSAVRDVRRTLVLR